jgi:hypothetical protein
MRFAIGRKARANSSRSAAKLTFCPLEAPFEAVEVAPRNPLMMLQLTHDNSRGDANLFCKTSDCSRLRTEIAERAAPLIRNQNSLSEFVGLPLLNFGLRVQPFQKHTVPPVEQKMPSLVEESEPELIV